MIAKWVLIGMKSNPGNCFLARPGPTPATRTAKPFWIYFFEIFGITNKRVATFELNVKKLGGECEKSRLTAHNVYIQCTYDPV
jgi:hypothetical protein